MSRGIKAHFGRVFEICSLKRDELPPGHPDRKWKGRGVFQGNRVSDEHNDHAIFAELGSSPASMEAAKVINRRVRKPARLLEAASRCEASLYPSLVSGDRNLGAIAPEQMAQRVGQ